MACSAYVLYLMTYEKDRAYFNFTLDSLDNKDMENNGFWDCRLIIDYQFKKIKNIFS